MSELDRFKDFDATLLDPRWSSIEFGAGLKPKDYLAFARSDMKEGSDPRSRVNAFGNAKRALHLQVDVIVDAFGFSKLKKGSGFPSKREFCENVGLPVQNIITQLNKLRNKIEHDYILPEEQQVKDAIDIVELFLESTERYILNFPDNIVFPEYDAEVYGLTRIYNAKLIKGEGEVLIGMHDHADNPIFETYSVPSKEFYDWATYINHCSKKANSDPD